MAQLIPIHYRVQVAARRRLQRWRICGMVVVAACLAALGHGYAAQTKAHRALEQRQAEHAQRATEIARGEELRSQRHALQERMATIQHLHDDKVLLALLHTVASSFSDFEAMEYIQIDARGSTASTGPGPAQDGDFVVRMTGITANSTTLAQLMKRIGAKAQPGVQVKLESSKREPYLDSTVMRFQLVCRRAPALANDN